MGENHLLPSQEVGCTISLPLKGTQKMRFYVLTSIHFLLHHFGKLCQSWWLTPLRWKKRWLKWNKGSSFSQKNLKIMTLRREQSASVASLSIQQLQDMITNTIWAQYGGSSTSSLTYAKPYTKRIDNMRMPNGYQPPKFLQFDGKGNPKQHIAHFVETGENVGIQGDLLVK